ncbi:MAG: lytic transglycosylase domain-containing protein [Gammaproteobacteria bacterium]|nr:lytic transglycosylase domain-containing protein [Gammaproteobacteria bacterium]MBU1725337.1 lytic transglycosylase domain-containing protein [Gammaproteobacteria bacterium]MBU2004346.1 lytic transglycosylase domain-containing protein [Gammaproteobacteria bacterium]
MHRLSGQVGMSVFAIFLSLCGLEAKAGVVKTCDQHSIETLNEKAAQYKQEIAEAAEKYKVDPALIKSVITVESCFRPTAYSRRKAAGLMQLIPSTAKHFGAFDVFDPAENIDAGANYLRYLLKRYKGSVTHAVAAYNAGESRVKKGQEQITVRFTETRRYVGKVLNAYTKFSMETEDANRLLSKWHESEAVWRGGVAKLERNKAVKKAAPVKQPHQKLNIHWAVATATRIRAVELAEK